MNYEPFPTKLLTDVAMIGRARRMTHEFTDAVVRAAPTSGTYKHEAVVAASAVLIAMCKLLSMDAALVVDQISAMSMLNDPIKKPH